MKRIWLRLLTVLLVCALLAPCALAEFIDESADVEAPVDEQAEFIIGGDDGESIEGYEEATETILEVGTVEVGFDGEGMQGAEQMIFGGDEQTIGMAFPASAYQTTLQRSGKLGTVSFTLGDTLQLVPKFASDAGVSVTGYKSSKPKVATVDAYGKVTTLAEGSTKITVTTTNKKIKATLTLKVVDPYKPNKIFINQGKNATMYLGQTIQLTTYLEPVSAKATLTWTSSKPDIASVDGTGRITAHREGSAKITVKTHNGKKATFKVKVDGIYVNPNVHYRALVIGQCQFPWSSASSLPGDRDASLMQKMLTSVRGPEGNSWVVNKQINRTYNQIYSDIRYTFSGATNSDVSLFYISTHGDQSTSYYRSSIDAGALLTYDDEMLSLHQLAAWLNDVPGKVIVMIDSCGSGAAIYGYNKSTESSFDPVSFDQTVIDAFAGMDQGVSAPWDNNQGAFILTNKFYVLTASSYMEYSWCTDKYSFFTKWVCDAVKTKGKMPADGNKNKFTTLNELYQYVRAKSDKQRFRSDGYIYMQHTQVYPSNSEFQLFYRK